MDLATAPVHWNSSTREPSQVAASAALVSDDTASIVAIHKWAGQCHSLAKRLGGAYSSMDELEGRDLLKHATAMDGATNGLEAAEELLGIARQVHNEAPSAGREHEEETKGWPTTASQCENSQRRLRSGLFLRWPNHRHPRICATLSNRLRRSRGSSCTEWNCGKQSNGASP